MAFQAVGELRGGIPRLRESGKRKKTRTTLPLPLSDARRALWMPTLSTVRVNPWWRAYYQQLRVVGKPAKVALVAAMCKLMAMVYSVARRRRSFTLVPVSPLVMGGAVTPDT
jgi:transposase